MLWIEDIVDSTLTPPFLSILVLIWLIVDLHKVVVRKCAFSALPRAQNERIFF